MNIFEMKDAITEILCLEDKCEDIEIPKELMTTINTISNYTIIYKDLCIVYKCKEDKVFSSSFCFFKADKFNTDKPIAIINEIEVEDFNDEEDDDGNVEIVEEVASKSKKKQYMYFLKHSIQYDDVYTMYNKYIEELEDDKIDIREVSYSEDDNSEYDIGESFISNNPMYIKGDDGYKYYFIKKMFPHIKYRKPEILLDIVLTKITDTCISIIYIVPYKKLRIYVSYLYVKI